MSQLAVMREEFNEKLPQKDRFNEIGDILIENAGSAADGKNIDSKLDNINKKWDDLLGQLGGLVFV